MTTFAPAGEPNVPGWTFDGRISGDNATNVTHTLSNTYDYVLIEPLTHYDSDDAPTDLARDIVVRFNGISRSVYDYVDNSGTQTTGASRIPVPSLLDGFVMWANGRSSNANGFKGGIQSKSPKTGNTTGFALSDPNNTIGDMSTINIIEPTGNGSDFRIDVYGRTF